MIYYLLVINIIGFVLFYLDKQKAIHHQWRISEKTLFAIALLGGSLGCLCGMYSFHHKTKHWYFVYGMPAIFIAQCIIGYYFKIFTH